MRQKKNRKKKKNRKIRILTGVVLGVGLAGALFFNVFKIRNIQVAGNTRYTKDEIKEMVADDKWMKNTVLLTTFHSKVDMSDIPFMNSVEFTFVSYDTICIQVEVYTAAEHAFVATYLVPTAGEGLYQLDRDTRQVIVLEDPAGADQGDEGAKPEEDAKQSDKK